MASKENVSLCMVIYDNNEFERKKTDETSHNNKISASDDHIYENNAVPDDDVYLSMISGTEEELEYAKRIRRKVKCKDDNNEHSNKKKADKAGYTDKISSNYDKIYENSTVPDKEISKMAGSDVELECTQKIRRKISGKDDNSELAKKKKADEAGYTYQTSSNHDQIYENSTVPGKDDSKMSGTDECTQKTRRMVRDTDDNSELAKEMKSEQDSCKSKINVNDNIYENSTVPDEYINLSMISGTDGEVEYAKKKKVSSKHEVHPNTVLRSDFNERAYTRKHEKDTTATDGIVDKDENVYLSMVCSDDHKPSNTVLKCNLTSNDIIYENSRVSDENMYPSMSDNGKGQESKKKKKIDANNGKVNKNDAMYQNAEMQDGNVYLSMLCDNDKGQESKGKQGKDVSNSIVSNYDDMYQIPVMQDANIYLGMVSGNDNEKQDINEPDNVTLKNNTYENTNKADSIMLAADTSRNKKSASNLTEDCGQNIATRIDGSNDNPMYLDFHSVKEDTNEGPYLSVLPSDKLKECTQTSSINEQSRHNVDKEELYLAMLEPQTSSISQQTRHNVDEELYFAMLEPQTSSISEQTRHNIDKEELYLAMLEPNSKSSRNDQEQTKTEEGIIKEDTTYLDVIKAKNEDMYLTILSGKSKPNEEIIKANERVHRPEVVKKYQNDSIPRKIYSSLKLPKMKVIIVVLLVIIALFAGVIFYIVVGGEQATVQSQTTTTEYDVTQVLTDGILPTVLISNYSILTTGIYKQTKLLYIPRGNPKVLYFVDNNSLWCVTSTELFIYNWEGRLKHTISFENLHQGIRSVLRTKNGNIIVGDSITGIHLHGKDGRYQTLILKSIRVKYLSEHGGDIFALISWTESSQTSVVMIFQCMALVWKQIKQVIIADNINLHAGGSMYVSNDHMFISNVDGSGFTYALYRRNGTLVVHKTKQDWLENIRICGVDSHGNVLLTQASTTEMTLFVSGGSKTISFQDKPRLEFAVAKESGQSVWVITSSYRRIVNVNSIALYEQQ